MAKNFSGQRLRGRRFRGDLRGGCFRDADLRGASFRGADLALATFLNAKLGKGGWRKWRNASVAFIAGIIAALLSIMATFAFQVLVTLVSGALLPALSSGTSPNIDSVQTRDFWIAVILLPVLTAGAAIAARLGRFWSIVSGMGITVAITVAAPVAFFVFFLVFSANYISSSDDAWVRQGMVFLLVGCCDCRRCFGGDGSRRRVPS
jgi:hypothetical protein